MCTQLLTLEWKSAPYIYTCFSREMAGFLRRLGLPYLFLLDDALGQRYPARTPTRAPRQLASAGAAAFIVLSLKVALDYFVHPTESVLIPRTRLVWLACKWISCMPPSRFRRRRQPHIQTVVISLGSPSVHFTTLRSLVGKLGALALAAPGILIKLQWCYTALAVFSRSPSTVLRVTGLLRDELRELASMHFWRAAVAPWMRPVHLTIVVSESVIQGTTVRGRCAPGEVLV
jgi:hypothetical protein